VIGPVAEYKASDAALKNMSEMLAADAEDESLRRYKESLLGAAAKGDLGNTSDPRRVVITEYRIAFAPEEERPDIVFSFATLEGVEKLKEKGVEMKEGCKYKFVISFHVQHDIVAGMKFVHTVKKAIFKNKEELMIGSYPPASVPHNFTFPRHEYLEAPAGMMYRGTYSCKNQFIDSDGVNHLELDYDLRINKTWE